MKLEWKTCFKIGISIFVLYLCIYYWSGVSGFLGALLGATLPLLTGAIMAYIINIVLSFFERYFFPKTKSAIIIKLRRPACIAISMIVLLAVIALVVALVVPQLVSAVALLIKELPDAIRAVIDGLEGSHFLSADLVAQLEAIDWTAMINQGIDILTSGIGSIMDIAIKTVSQVFSAVISTVFSIMFALYLLAGKDKLSAQIRRLMKNYMPLFWREKVSYTATVLNDCFHKFIVGQFIEALILGSLCTIGMLVLRLPYATMIGALVAFTALIPVVGAYIGAIIGAFMILTVSPTQALIFLIFLIILQQLEGNLIYPKVVGSSVGLPGIWVLAAVTVFGGILGIFGMLLGVPVTAAAYRLLREDVNKREAAAEKIAE